MQRLTAALFAALFLTVVWEPADPVEKCTMDRETGVIICEDL